MSDRRATRLLVIRWSRMVHVGIEDVTGQRNASAVAMHYVRPDDTRSCVQRVLDAALPLSLEDAERPTPTTAPPVEGRGTTVAPDGRE